MKMRYSLISGVLFSLGIAAVLGAGSAMAEPVPLPTMDFQVKARTMGKGEMTLHHQAAGKTRVEMQLPSMPEIVGIIDLKTRKMLMIGAIPGMSSMAIEVGLGHDLHLSDHRRVTPPDRRRARR